MFSPMLHSITGQPISVVPALNMEYLRESSFCSVTCRGPHCPRWSASHHSKMYTTCKLNKLIFRSIAMLWVDCIKIKVALINRVLVSGTRLMLTSSAILKKSFTSVKFQPVAPDCSHSLKMCWLPLICSIESMADVPPSTIPRESRTFCWLRRQHKSSYMRSSLSVVTYYF